MRRILYAVWAGVLLGSVDAAAAGYSLDDIVLAAQRGMAASTLTMLAGERGAHPLSAEQTTTLLRSGVPQEVIDHLTGGVHPTAQELAASKRPGPVWALPGSHKVPAQLSAEEQEAAEEAAFRASPIVEYRYNRGFRVCSASLQGIRVSMLLAHASDQAWVSVSLANGTNQVLLVDPDQVTLERRRGSERVGLRRLLPTDLASAYESSWWMDYLEERALTLQSFQSSSVGSSSARASGTAWGSEGWVTGALNASASGSSTTFGSVEGTARDKIAAREYLDQKRERRAASRDQMLESLLWKSTVAPSDAVSGQVVFSVPRARPDERYAAALELEGVAFKCVLEPRQ